MGITPETEAEVRDSPVYWFVVLGAARERGDYALAAEADRELKRLGVQVMHTRRHRRKEAAHAQR